MSPVCGPPHQSVTSPRAPTLLASALLACASLFASPQIVPRAPTKPVLLVTAPDRLVQPGDLMYQGAFRLPQGPIGGSSFDYGGTALAFNAAHQSLFLVGHDWQQQVAEVSIPAIRIGTVVSDLATATVLQPFADPTDGLRGQVDTSGPTIKIGGLLPYAGRLFVTAYVYYDGNGSQRRSHFISGLDLSLPADARGPYQVGSLGAGFVSGWLVQIPAAWQAALGGPVLNGQCCLSIISRTSYGPSAFAINPEQLGVVDPLPAIPLLYYPSTHPLGPYDGQSTLFNGSTVMAGAVFPVGTRSLLFVGKQGTGAICYGPGTTDVGLVGTGPPGDTFCFDPAIPGKGYHAYPYRSYVWAYDALELAAVKSGQRPPWDVQPYAVWSLSLPFGSTRILGAAYDPMTGRIFLSQEYGDGENPLVHVYTLK